MWEHIMNTLYMTQVPSLNYSNVKNSFKPLLTHFKLRKYHVLYNFGVGALTGVVREWGEDRHTDIYREKCWHHVGCMSDGHAPSREEADLLYTAERRGGLLISAGCPQRTVSDYKHLGGRSFTQCFLYTLSTSAHRPGKGFAISWNWAIPSAPKYVALPHDLPASAVFSNSYCCATPQLTFFSFLLVLSILHLIRFTHFLKILSNTSLPFISTQPCALKILCTICTVQILLDVCFSTGVVNILEA